MIDARRPSRRNLIYLAGPIRGKTPTDRRAIRRNVKRAKLASQELWRRGWNVHCPHMNTDLPDEGDTNTEAQDKQLGFDDFIAGDKEIISRCDAVVILPGWRDSQGTLDEIQFAADRCIPVVTLEHMLPGWEG